MSSNDQTATKELSALSEAVSLLPDYIEKIKEQASKAALSIEAEGESEGFLRLAKLADQISRMISIVGIVHRESMELCGSASPDSGLKSVEIHLLSILKAIKSAEGSGDRVMLADLLEYELQDNLTQWKIKAVPKIREMIQSFRQRN